MDFQYLLVKFDGIVSKCCKPFITGKFWLFKVAAFSILLSVVFGSLELPTTENLTRDPEAFEFHSKKIEHPFQQQTFPAVSHFSKRSFRITVSLLAHILHLSHADLVYIEFGAGFLIFFMMAKWFSEKIKSAEAGALAAFALAFCMFGKFAFIDSRLLMDGYSFCFILAAMVFPNPIIILISSFALAFNDERGALCTLSISMFWYISIKYPSITFKNLFKIPIQALMPLVALVLYLVLRFYLSRSFGLSISGGKEGAVGLSVFGQIIQSLPIGLYSGIEFFFVFLVVCLFYLAVSGEWLACAIWILGWFPILISSVLVFDISKSSCYVIPGLFAAVIIVQKSIPNFNWKRNLAYITIANFMLGSYMVNRYVADLTPIPIVKILVRH